MRDSGWDQFPPDVRFAGEPAEMRAPPWIAVSPIQHLTEKPSCEAGHKTAPDQNAKNIESTLAMREPSTQDVQFAMPERPRFADKILK